MDSTRLFSAVDFCIDASSEVVSGYTDGATWNGWACPYFEYEVACRVIKSLTEKWIFDTKDDSFLVRLTGSPEDEYEIYKGHEISVDGGQLRVYAIGAYSWIWEICSSS